MLDFHYGKKVSKIIPHFEIGIFLSLMIFLFDIKLKLRENESIHTSQYLSFLLKAASYYSKKCNVADLLTIYATCSIHNIGRIIRSILVLEEYQGKNEWHATQQKIFTYQEK